MAGPAKESLESCGGNTSLLVVRTIETVSGRHGTAGRNDLNRHSDYSQLESIMSSICNKLSKRVQVRTRIMKDPQVSSTDSPKDRFRNQSEWRNHEAH